MGKKKGFGSKSKSTFNVIEEEDVLLQNSQQSQSEDSQVKVLETGNSEDQSSENEAIQRITKVQEKQRAQSQLPEIPIFKSNAANQSMDVKSATLLKVDHYHSIDIPGSGEDLETISVNQRHIRQNDKL